MRSKASKLELDNQLRTKLDTSEFRNLAPEGVTPREFFNELIAEGIKKNGEGISNTVKVWD